MDAEVLAEQVKMERLRRGWTLEQISDLTRISITVLRLIEEKRFEKIGGKRTVEMLLRAYSNALGDKEPAFESFSANGASIEGGGRRSGRRKLRSGFPLPAFLGFSS